MSNNGDQLDPRFALVLAVPNVLVVGVWAFTFANEWFLYTNKSIPVYVLAIFGGGMASVFGMAVSLMGCDRNWRFRRWWRVSLAVNVAGLMVNLAGFIVYITPGC